MKKIPDGYNTLTPTLVVNGAVKAIELYKKAFGATEDYRAEMPDDKNKLMHACINIGTSKVFICDTSPMCNTASVSAFYVYVNDVDTSFKQAHGAGLKEIQPVQDMFWGDRTGCLQDAFGITWTIATHVRDVSPEEIEEAKRKAVGKAA